MPTLQAERPASFKLCVALDLPVVFLRSKPCFVVKPEHESRPAVGHVTMSFVPGARLTVPFGVIVLRKAYGPGAQATTGRSFKAAF